MLPALLTNSHNFKGSSTPYKQAKRGGTRSAKSATLVCRCVLRRATMCEREGPVHKPFEGEEQLLSDHSYLRTGAALSALP